MTERFAIVEQTLVKMLEERKFSALREVLVSMNPSDIAGLFAGWGEQMLPLLFRKWRRRHRRC